MAIKKQAGLVSGGTLTTEEWKAEQQLGGCMNARHRSSCQSRSSPTRRATNLRTAKYWTIISSLTWIVYNSATMAHAAHAVWAVDNYGWRPAAPLVTEMARAVIGQKGDDTSIITPNLAKSFAHIRVRRKHFLW
jgi:hypothetical protein